MLLTIPNTFANGTGAANIIDAVEMNANFNAVATVLNGNIEKNNIKTGSAICLNDTAMTISATWTFNTFPTVPDASVPDAKLSANIPLKNATNTFSAKQTFSAKIDMAKTEIEQIVIHKLAAAPGSPANGQIYYNTTDNKYYGWNGSAWKQLDYVGDYTGGAVRSYPDFGIVDDGNSYKLYFKTEGGSPTVKIAIKGEQFPKRFYTELGYHNHTFTPTAHNHGVTDGGHTHITNIGSHDHGSKQFSLGVHEHTVPGYTDYATKAHTHNVGTLQDDGHIHGGVTTGSGDTDSSQADLSGATASNDINHRHQVSLSAQASSQKDDVDSASIGNKTSASSTTGLTVNNANAQGTVGYEGVNGGALSTAQKQYAKSLTVKIDGTDVTSNILTSTGWSAIGDGSDSHAFHTTGTGEMDASGWKTYAAGFHTIEIIESESGYGSGLLIHIETL